mmetsp:Transcript_3231/g.8978  ORF Transcript_3231/g.8978 Transcript_3231/m.8978 type:complete len:348 (-) Transcript_3231:344-1387(-)
MYFGFSRSLQGSWGKACFLLMYTPPFSSFARNRFFLRLRHVPHIVSREQEAVAHELVRERVGGLLLVPVPHQVHALQAVHERDPREVPKDEHEAKLLVKDVPRHGNALLPLHHGVAVQEVREQDEPHVPVPQDVEPQSLQGVSRPRRRGGRLVQGLQLRLLHARAEGQHEEEDPRDPPLGEHLEVHPAHPRVEDRAEEEVVDVVARHPVRVPRRQRPKVQQDGEDVAEDDRHRQHLPVVVVQPRPVKYSRGLRDQHDPEGQPPRGQAVDQVRQPLGLVVLHGAAPQLRPRHEGGQEELAHEESGVERDRERRGPRVLRDRRPHVRPKFPPVEKGVPQLGVVVDQAVP